MSIPTWLEYANAFGTLAAAGLAAWTIRQSTKSSDENQKALIRERRIDFELDVLADLAELNTQSSNVSSRDARMRTRAAMLGEGVIPITRAAFNLESTADALTRVNVHDVHRSEQRQSMPDYFKKEIEAEILAAIEQRLRDRG